MNQRYEPILKAVIPAAGLGTRLRPLTGITPKEMLPLGSKPAVQYIIEELYASGVREITFVISPSKTTIEHFFGDRACKGEMHLNYVVQYEPRGLADAILKAEVAMAGEQFIVALGDTIIASEHEAGPLDRLLALREEQKAWATINVEEVEIADLHLYGVVHPTKNGCELGFQIDGAVEKPEAAFTPSRFAIGGRYVFGPEIFDLIRHTKPGAKGEQQITDSIVLGIREGYPVWCAPLVENEIRHDIGNMESYCEAFAAMCFRDDALAPSMKRASQQALRELLSSGRGSNLPRWPGRGQ